MIIMEKNDNYIISENILLGRTLSLLWLKLKFTQCAVRDLITRQSRISLFIWRPNIHGLCRWHTAIQSIAHLWYLLVPRISVKYGSQCQRQSQQQLSAKHLPQFIKVILYTRWVPFAWWADTSVQALYTNVYHLWQAAIDNFAFTSLFVRDAVI